MKNLQTNTTLGYGKAQIHLVNLTNTAIDYVVGDTRQLFMPEQSNVTLQALSLPVIVKLHRHDECLLDIRVYPTGLTGDLQITLNESTDFPFHCLAIEIGDDGAITLNESILSQSNDEIHLKSSVHNWAA